MLTKTFIFIVLCLVLTCSPEKLPAQKRNTPKTGIEIGDIAPNIMMQDVNGSTLSLYDLRGNIVLITFWAAWCRPCRHENKEIAEIFRTFQNEKFDNGAGFRIFSVSLDKNRENWISAIKNDGMVWSEHVSNLNGWESPVAKTYDIRSIPANLLIDKDGVIISKNANVDRLEEILNQLIE